MTTGSSASNSFGTILESNKVTMQEIENFKNENITTLKRNLSFVALTFLALILFGFFALQIITGAVALVVTLVSAVGGFYGYKYIQAMDPAIRQKIKNKALKTMVDEARKNAVQQLDNQILLNTQKLEDARQSRNKMGALIEQMKNSLYKSEATSPNYQRKQDMLERVKAAYEQVETSLEKAAKANRQFEKKVGEYKEMKEFTDLAQGAMDIFEGSSGMNIEEMLSLEAFKSIELDFTTSLVTIENSAKDLALTNSLDD